MIGGKVPNAYVRATELPPTAYISTMGLTIPTNHSSSSLKRFNEA
ncbi:hypothetical protein T11_11203 [Trichinella zimbabwensis]|uniref:Uncharacterized protein n=1 Tax=Trichinella zimbabwensis TaxID=268475 RepID=A0A0V1GF49_9BILA|nr:hypothetical protein T11_11203 [Trichinella zimbabwensis]